MEPGLLIERHLAELERVIRPLPSRHRHRIMTEALNHLEDARASVGVEEAIRRFGDPVVVGRAHLERAVTEAPVRSVVVFGASGLAYGAVQALASPATFGLFPGGPWPNDVPPRWLGWKVDVAGGLIAVAAMLGVAAILAAVIRRHAAAPARRVLPAKLAAIGAFVFAASWPFETVFLVQRGHEVAGSPPTAVTAVVCAAFLVCHGLAVIATLQLWRVARTVVTAVAEPLS